MSWMTCPIYGTTECHSGVCDVCGSDGDSPCPPTSEVEVVTEQRGFPPRSITFARRTAYSHE